MPPTSQKVKRESFGLRKPVSSRILSRSVIKTTWFSFKQLKLAKRRRHLRSHFGSSSQTENGKTGHGRTCVFFFSNPIQCSPFPPKRQLDEIRLTLGPKATRVARAIRVLDMIFQANTRLMHFAVAERWKSIGFGGK